MGTEESRGKGDRGLEEADTAAAIEQADDVGSIETLDSEHAVESAPIDTADTVAGSDVGPGTAAPTHFEEGAKIGRFLIIKKLGEGGMGVVLAAYDPLLDRKVAVKLLRPQSFGKHVAEQARQRLIREAQAMAKITHANVLPVFDAGEIGEAVFIAMEYNDGETLGQWAKRDQRSWRDVLDVYIRAGRGLAAAHRAGLVHRDFKPDNVLISRDGRVRVTDFGLVSAATPSIEDVETGLPTERDSDARMNPEQVALALSLTRTGEIMGTPVYMAPEQHLGEATDARTDQFGFCAALYESLYHQLPFAGDTYGVLASNVLAGKVVEAPSDAAVPARIREILLRGLSIDKETRFASMEELLDDLAHDPYAVRRRRLVVLGVGVVIVALAALSAFGLLRGTAAVSRLCKGAEVELGGVWNDRVKEDTRAAFVGTGRPYAADTFRRVERLVDDYSQEWIAMRTDACEATRVRGEQSERLLDLRMFCLNRRLGEVKALVWTLTSRVDQKVLDNAVDAASALGSLARCADREALEAAVPPPEDAATRAKSEALFQLLSETKTLEDTGKYDEGLQKAQLAVQQAKQLAYAPAESAALYRLGVMQDLTGDGTIAEATLYHAAQRAAEAKDLDLLAHVWTYLVHVVGGTNARYQDGVTLGRVAEAAVATGGDDELRALLYTSLGSISNTHRRHDEARGYHERALKIRERIHEPDHPDLAVSLNGLGSVMHGQGKFAEAQQYFERALAISERALGPEHPRVAAHYNNLGLVLKRQRRLAEAMELHEKAWSIQKKSLGPEHPDVAITLTNMADVLADQGKPEEARRFYERALEIKEKTLGPKHPDLAITLNNLGLLADELKRPEEARGFYVRALRIQEEALGDKHASLGFPLLNIGISLLDQEDYAKAIPYLERAVAIWEETLGVDHPNLAHPLHGLGKCYLGLHQAAEAVSAFRRALTIRAASQVDPTYVADTQCGLAVALWEAGGDRQEAIDLAIRARDAYAAAPPRYAPDANKVRTWLRKRGVK